MQACTVDVTNVAYLKNLHSCTCYNGSLMTRVRETATHNSLVSGAQAPCKSSWSLPLSAPVSRFARACESVGQLPPPRSPSGPLSRPRAMCDDSDAPAIQYYVDAVLCGVPVTAASVCAAAQANQKYEKLPLSRPRAGFDPEPLKSTCRCRYR